MIKLSKYLKPFLLPLIAVVVLLFTQAQCELALPDYMSNIVSVGIQTGGIKNGVPQAIRESEAQKLFVFMEEDEVQLFQTNYSLTDSSNATSEQVSRYPLLTSDKLYLLNQDSKEVNEQLNTSLSKAEMIVGTLQSEIAKGEDGKFADLVNQLPAGMDPFTALANMSKESINEMKEQVDVQIEAMGQSTVSAAAASFVKNEYQVIGINTESIQNTYIFQNGATMLAIALGSALCAIIVTFLAAKIAAGVAKNMRNDVFAKVESFSSAEFNQFSPATLITRTTNDVQQIQQVLVMVLRIVIYAPIMGIGAVLKVINSNVSMTWIIALVVVIILSIMMVAFTVVMPKFAKMQQLIDKMNSVLREFLDGLPVIRAFNTQKQEEQKFDKANRDITKTNLFVNRVMACLMPLMMLVMNSVSILIVWVGGHQIELGNLQIGQMMAFMQYSMQIIMSFLMITMISIMIPRAGVAIKRVMEVLNCDVSIKDPETSQEFSSRLAGQVEFKHVSFRYPGAEEDVLHDINLIAPAGKTTAFIGSTGSGKSTIINLVPRFFDVTEGSVEVSGVDVRQVSQHNLRERIGYVPQKGVLFSGTIESNLHYANEQATEADLQQAAVIAQAMDFIEAKPEKFESAITQGGTNVSGGQKQRLSIARALVRNPEVYIFDDSFSALDFKTDSNLRRALNELCTKTGSTVLLVAQRISSIMHADQIVVLDQGRIAGVGTHKQLLQNCDVYQEIAYSQLSKEELGNE